MQGEDSVATGRGRWQISINGKLKGTYDLAELSALAQNGRLSPYTLIRKEHGSDWRLLSAVPELAPFLALIPSSATSVSLTPTPQSRRSHRLAMLAVLTDLLLVAGYQAWLVGWIGLDLWPWYRPFNGARHIENGRWIRTPDEPGIYALDRGKMFKIGQRQIKPRTDLSSEVEFLLTGLPEASLRRYILYQLGPSKELGKFSVKSELGFTCLPVKKRPGVVRLIPNLPLDPGYYVLDRYGFFIGFERCCNDALTRTEQAFKQEDWPEVLKQGSLFLSLNGGATTSTEARRKEWSDRIIQVLDRDTVLSPTLLVPAMEALHAWYPKAGSQAAESCRKRIGAAIRKASINHENVETWVQLAATADAATSPTTFAAVWEALSARLSDPAALGRESFFRLLQLCDQGCLPVAMRRNATWDLAESLSLYERGNKREAIKIWEQLADSGNTSVAQTARKLIAPPPDGIRTMKRDPIVFKQDGREALRVELVSFQVWGDEIRLDLRAQNADGRPRSLIYAEGASSSILDYKSLYLTDDVDPEKCFYSPKGYIGGGERGVDERSNLRDVPLPPGQPVEIHVSFPRVSPGATRVTFTSPAYRGQSQWRWVDLPLKGGPFEAPLPTLPLRATGMLHSADASIDKSARPSAPTTVTVQFTPAPAPTSDPTPQPESQSQEAHQPSKAAIAQGTPEATSKPNNRAQAQAAAARQNAERERGRCRSRLGRSPLRKSLFDAAEGQRRYAEAAYRAGNYTQAELYFKQAASVYKQGAP